MSATPSADQGAEVLIADLPADELARRLMRERLIAEPSGWVSRAQVIEEVGFWVEDEGEDRVPTNNRVFAALRSAGARDSKRGGWRGFAGVMLRDAQPSLQVAQFMETCFYPDGSGDFTGRDYVLEAYDRWFDRQDEFEDLLSPRALYAAMRSEGARDARQWVNRGDQTNVKLRGFADLALRSNWNPRSW
jgi:hypothetical protein